MSVPLKGLNAELKLFIMLLQMLAAGNLPSCRSDSNGGRASTGNRGTDAGSLWPAAAWRQQ
jgi:hypothetical protein